MGVQKYSPKQSKVEKPYETRCLILMYIVIKFHNDILQPYTVKDYNRNALRTAMVYIFERVVTLLKSLIHNLQKYAHRQIVVLLLTKFRLHWIKIVRSSYPT